MAYSAINAEASVSDDVMRSACSAPMIYEPCMSSLCAPVGRNVYASAVGESYWRTCTK